MPPLANENNSQGIATEIPNELTSYQHDPNYYYPDGSTVILVGDVLFKFQLSLVLGSCNIHTASGRIPEDSTLQRQLTNSSDNNPAKLEGFTPNQFRNFLSVVLGLPSDPGYLALLTGAQDVTKHESDLLVKYLDITLLSHQFRMIELEEWARKQLKLVLRSSHKFIRSEWDKTTLYQLHSYARTSEDIETSVKAFIQYFISASTHEDQQLSLVVPSNFSTCIELYKDDTLKKRDPILFGCAFAAIVSQHHQTWTSPLTQRDRALLYVAQVQLTPITKELQSLRWLQAPVSELPFFTRICSACRSELPRFWIITFGKCQSLGSHILLEDISLLARLPQYFHTLSQAWGNASCTGLPNSGARAQQRPSPTYTGIVRLVAEITGSDLLVPRGPIRESRKCCNRYLSRIGTLVDEVYKELAVLHTRFALDA